MRRLLKRLVLLCGAAVLLLVLYLVAVWPLPSWYRSHWPDHTAFMHLRERSAKGADTVRHYQPVPLEDISPLIRRAVLTGEDDAFYQHHGIDWRSLREALGYKRNQFNWTNARDRGEMEKALGHAAQRSDKLRGASTITQQLAKNLYLSPSRNPLRKLKEAVTAYRLEWALSKDRILALYLNVAEFGPNLWGVEAASRRYFGKSARSLTLEEAALLAATLPHPLTSNPGYHPARTRARQHLILRRMHGDTIEVPSDEGEEKTPAPDSMPAISPESAAPDR
ncbi:MAG TPA: biosynthetic peptidoglycan transglycosylase [Gemmatimonadales bacterium]|jgi:monofunctional biosynthetic peptidoglycan transglycosylase